MIRAAALLCCLALICSSAAESREWYVSAGSEGDAPSVQAGIDSCAAADTVLVGAGTYLESIDFKGKVITVMSESGPQVTILDGSTHGTAVVIFQSGEPNTARLQGFTIQGGTGVTTPNLQGGGGVYILESEPTIVGNVIRDNYTIQVGAGVGCFALTASWEPIICDNVFSNNVADLLGGGLAATNSVAPKVLRNHFIGNQAVRGDGGAMSLRISANGCQVLDNLIEENIAGDHGGGIYGGQVRSINGPLEIEIANNIIARNTAEHKSLTLDCAGAMWLYNTNAWIHHNTIVSNGCSPTNTFPGGVALGSDGTPVFEHNILAFTWQGGGIYCLSGVTPVIRNNLAWANVNGDALICNWSASDGNLVADPLFCNLGGGSYSLAMNSPALSHPSGAIGAVLEAGCGPVTIMPATWGSLKARYLPD